MSERTITSAEAQDILSRLAEQELAETLIITHEDQPRLTLMPYHIYQELLANIESLKTVLEIMLVGTQPSAGAHAKKQETPALATKSTSWEEFKDEVGWE